MHSIVSDTCSTYGVLNKDIVEAGNNGMHDMNISPVTIPAGKHSINHSHSHNDAVFQGFSAGQRDGEKDNREK